MFGPRAVIGCLCVNEHRSGIHHQGKLDGGLRVDVTCMHDGAGKTYAEALGITNLSEEVLTALCQDVEYRTRELIQDATKFMQHAKRTKLAVSDVNHALQARNAEVRGGLDVGRGWLDGGGGA